MLRHQESAKEKGIEIKKMEKTVYYRFENYRMVICGNAMVTFEKVWKTKPGMLSR